MVPAAAPGEVDGHVTDWEGRSQRVRRVRGPIGSSRPDWEIFAGLAEAFDAPLGFSTLEDLQEEMARLLAPRELGGDAAPASAGVPAPSGELLLMAYPLLVDEGRLSEDAGELKEAQQQAAFAELHPEDAEAAGIADGSEALVKTDAGEARLPVRITSGIAKGTVFVPYNNPGLRANTLLSGFFVTPVSIEPVEDGAEDGS
jgi:predicted molibdopterin-dependent oxidoreductase YjgC